MEIWIDASWCGFPMFGHDGCESEDLKQFDHST
jgi:hypothetical protein